MQVCTVEVYISMACHGTIDLCGLVTIGTELCSAKDAPKLVLVVARAATLRPIEADCRCLLINILRTPPSCGNACHRAYGGSAGLLRDHGRLTVRGFFRHNRKQYEEFSLTRP